MKIDNVTIVGGGTSGWMTAAAFCRAIPEIKVTLIESPDIKTTQVGESTLQQFNHYLNLIGLEDKDWMKQCDATYKISIKFTDFREIGSEFHYPFGRHNSEQMGRGLDTWGIIRQLNPEYNTLDKFSCFYNPLVNLAFTNKMTDNDDNIIPNFFFDEDTAYHLDATKFGIYLRDNICIPSGITHIKSNVVDIVKKSTGDIECLVLEDSTKVHSDLFIDCTGFKSLLLEEAMGSKFISFSETLLNDKALSAKVPYDDIDRELENFTNCTAIENGWVWNIPLWSRIGTGYCYSSKFASREQAEKEFRKYLETKGKTLPEDYEFNEIDIRHGKREKAWVGNVIGVGLSYAFIEPLESTGLLTTHDNIYKLIKLLQRRNGWVSGLDKSIFNRYLDNIIDGTRSFIEMHYALSMRSDTDYWNYVTSIEYDNDYDVSQLETNCLRYSNFSGLQGGMPYIAAGMGYIPSYKFGKGIPGTGTISPEETDALESVGREFMMFTDSIRAYCTDLKTSYEFLKETIYD